MKPELSTANSGRMEVTEVEKEGLIKEWKFVVSLTFLFGQSAYESHKAGTLGETQKTLEWPLCFPNFFNGMQTLLESQCWSTFVSTFECAIIFICPPAALLINRLIGWIQRRSDMGRRYKHKFGIFSSKLAKRTQFALERIRCNIRKWLILCCISLKTLKYHFVGIRASKERALYPWSLI